MSGLCLIADLRGGRVERARLDSMVAACAERSRERVAVATADGLAAAYVSGESLPGGAPASPPLPSADGRFTLLADARLDNRRELRAELAGDSDSELILAAFERWGRDCPRKLLGDYVFAIWDGLERSLFAARDALGVRCLYYALEGERLVVATGVGSVVAGLDSEPTLNRPLLEDFLAGRLDRWVAETTLRPVRRLPQAHTLEASSDRLSLRRYWTLGESAVRYRRREEYVEHFRELLVSAVRSRLVADEPVAAFVSGGLDSSSLVCLANDLRARGELACPLRLYSLVFDETPHADERAYLDAVLERCRDLPSARVRGDDAWALKEFGTDREYPLDQPELSLGRALWLRLLRSARSDGCRVAVTGNGGDQVLGGDAYAFPLNLLDVGWRRLRHEAAHFHAPGGLWRSVARRWLVERCPTALLAAARRARDDLWPLPPEVRLRPPSRVPVPDHLPPPALASHSARLSYRLLTSGSYSAGLAEVDHQARHVGVELRLPLLDRRLVDFMLGVPPELRFRDGLEKVLLRDALAEVLPRTVLRRTTHAHFSELSERGLRKESARASDLLTETRIVAAELVDGERLERSWLCYPEGKQVAQRVRGLTRALCLEAWLRYHQRSVAEEGRAGETGTEWPEIGEGHDKVGRQGGDAKAQRRESGAP